ncbi:MAG: DNA translocase FtsK [Planctomycetia bacterium]|jgi:S-DNA-T family DNA segregation ATPase FtsK/SpoIIIE
MLDNRDLKLDLLALGLLALTIFFAASVFSYAPSDPPSSLVYPASTDVQNLCGKAGAWLSSLSFEVLGLGTYFLLVSLAVLVVFLLARRPMNEPLLRLAGWLVALLGVTTLAAIAAPGFSPGPVIGAGGYVGATGRALMVGQFGAVGAGILAISLILGGLMLSVEYLLLRGFAWTVVLPARRAVRTVNRLVGIASGKEYEEEEASPAPTKKGKRDDLAVSVRTPKGNKSKKKADDVVAKYSDEVEEEAEVASDGKSAKENTRPLKVRKPKRSHREEILEEIAATTGDDPDQYELPSLDLLLESEEFCFDEHEKDVRRKAKILEHTFDNFGFNVRVVEIQTGPVIAQFEIELEAGLRLSRITSLADDLAIALRVPSVRIVAPIPGKNTVGIEIPNADRQTVRLREVMEEAEARTQKMHIPIFMGKDVAGNPMVFDLSTMPHLLIAGRTGTGKSVCLNSMIISMLMTRRPDEVRMLMIDPKMVELSPYKKLPHLMHPVVTDMRKAEAILAWAVEKMEERYQFLARAGVRHITSYNQLGEEELWDRMDVVDEEERNQIPTHMPFIVMIADEMADLMMTSAKEVETHIIRLAQKSRAVGIHLVLATQKPTVDVITGLIKSNLPARVSFQVASRTDSRVVLDEMGAERLLGNGDMLFLWPGTSTLIRGQGTYLSDEEINRVIDAVATSEPQFVTELVQLQTEDAEGKKLAFSDRDQLYEPAVDLVVREKRGSVSLLQRSLGIGYGRAARLIDYMAEDGFVGPYNGSQAREVLISLEDWEVMTGAQEASSVTIDVESTPPPLPKRDKTIRLSDPSESLLDEDEEYEDDEYEYEEDEETLDPISATHDVEVQDYDDEEEWDEEDEEEEDEDEEDDEEYEYEYEDEDEDEDDDDDEDDEDYEEDELEDDDEYEYEYEDEEQEYV